MKQFLSILCALFMITSLCGCTRTVKSVGDMLQIMEAKEHATGLQTLGIIEQNQYSFLAAVSGEAPQERRYYATAFRKHLDGTYSFAKAVPLTPCGWQAYFCKWQNGYVFICNNDDAACLQAIIDPIDSETIKLSIEIDKTPWIYYYQLQDVSGSYQGRFVFLDSAGNKIT